MNFGKILVMNEYAELIHNAALRLSKPGSLEDVYETIVSDSLNFVGADFGSIFLRKKGVLERVYASDPTLYTARIRDKGYTYKASMLESPSYIQFSKIQKFQPNLSILGVKSVVYIPLWYKNRSFGIISLDSLKRKEYSDEEMTILKLYGSIASLAMKKTEFYNETKQALEIRNFFISIAAHELRTPLTSISGYVQLLKKKMPNGESLESRWIEKLAHETNRLTILTKELLESNRIRAGVAEYMLKQHSLNDIIKRTINRLQYHYPDRELQYQNSLPNSEDIVVADYDKLIQVFYNLLENAIKYSPEDEPIGISMDFRKPHLVVKIRDKGVGIEFDRLKQILDGTYNHVDDGSEKAGIGLGLFLVKKIIEKHNGFISIKSAKRKGTTVTVKLPKFYE